MYTLVKRLENDVLMDRFLHNGEIYNTYQEVFKQIDRDVKTIPYFINMNFPLLASDFLEKLEPDLDILYIFKIGNNEYHYNSLNSYLQELGWKQSINIKYHNYREFWTSNNSKAQYRLFGLSLKLSTNTNFPVEYLLIDLYDIFHKYQGYFDLNNYSKEIREVLQNER